MTSGRCDNVGTTPVRPGYGFEEGALVAWMRENVEGYEGPLGVEQFKGGQSNPTYKLTTPARSYVLRRKPPGKLLKGAHAIEREAKVLRGLHVAGFPVARVFGLCTDERVIGTWFYVMEMVEGRIFWDAALPELATDERGAIFDAMNVAIAQLHSIDFEAAGLGDFGRGGNYFQRQIDRWSAQYFDDTMAGRDANMDRLIEWLWANIPDGDDATSLIHGDFRIDNMIFHPREPRILAVLDWELATLGHSGADFAYHAMMYRMPSRIVAGLEGVDLRKSGIPSEIEYANSYRRRTAAGSLVNYDYYMAFNFFRLAAIFHGIKGRSLRGTAASAQAKARIEVLPELMARAWGEAQRANTGSNR